MGLFNLVILATEEVISKQPWYNNPGVIALLGTIFGGVGLKFVEHLLGKAKERQAAAAEVVRDYRSEITELNDRLDKVEQEVGFWRNRFYEEQEANAVLRIMLIKNDIEPPQHVVRPPAESRAPKMP